MARFLDDRSFERTRDVVVWAEEERARPGDPEPQSYVEPVFVKVTSGTADGSGYYPGVVSVRRGPTNDWEDLTVTVRVKGPNAETLTNNSRYGCRPTGLNSSNEDTFVAMSVGGGSLTVREVASNPATTVETFTNVTTLNFRQGIRYSSTDYPTGLVVEDDSGSPRVSLLPCSLNADGTAGTHGGAILPSEQNIGERKRMVSAGLYSGSYAGLGAATDDSELLRIFSSGGSTKIGHIGLGVGTDGAGSGTMQLTARHASEASRRAVIALDASGSAGKLFFYRAEGSGRLAPGVEVGNGAFGQTGSFTSADSKTITVTAGWVTGIAAAFTAPADAAGWADTPDSPWAPGEPGQLAYDDKYLYLCVATATWGRLPLELDWHA